MNQINRDRTIYNFIDIINKKKPSISIICLDDELDEKDDDYGLRQKQIIDINKGNNKEDDDSQWSQLDKSVDNSKNKSPTNNNRKGRVSKNDRFIKSLNQIKPIPLTKQQQKWVQMNKKFKQTPRNHLKQKNNKKNDLKNDKKQDFPVAQIQQQSNIQACHKIINKMNRMNLINKDIDYQSYLNRRKHRPYIDLGVCTLNQLVDYAHSYNLISNELYLQFISHQSSIQKFIKFITIVVNENFVNIAHLDYKITLADHRRISELLIKIDPHRFIANKPQFLNQSIHSYLNLLYGLDKDEYQTIMEIIDNKTQNMWWKQLKLKFYKQFDQQRNNIEINKTKPDLKIQNDQMIHFKEQFDEKDQVHSHSHQIKQELQVKYLKKRGKHVEQKSIKQQVSNSYGNYQNKTTQDTSLDQQSSNKYTKQKIIKNGKNFIKKTSKSQVFNDKRLIEQPFLNKKRDFKDFNEQNKTKSTRLKKQKQQKQLFKKDKNILNKQQIMKKEQQSPIRLRKLKKNISQGQIGVRTLREKKQKKLQDQYYIYYNQLSSEEQINSSQLYDEQQDKSLILGMKKQKKF